MTRTQATPTPLHHALIEDFKAQGLLIERAYVNGAWIAARDGASYGVFNPSDGAFLGSVPALSADQAKDAIDGAHDAFSDWARTMPNVRAQKLRRWAELMRDEREDLALIMTLEQGKPLREAVGEIDYAAGFLDWFADEALRLAPRGVTSPLKDRATALSRAPVGVCALITPWNFPAAMITRKAAAALAVGCTVVVKPAPETPFSALALAVLAEKAGIEPGIFNVITGDAPMLAKVLCDDARVRALSFTGSTRVGRLLLEWAAPTVKRVSMELGGHAPFIVFADADLDKAVDDAIAAKFQTSGQDCLAANRILVEGDVYEAFAERFAEKAAALVVGDGLQPGVEIGPLMHEGAVEKCRDHVEDALKKGARLLAGGGRHPLGGLFFQPTVLKDVTSEMKIFSEETFGPVAALTPFKDEAEAIAIANATEYGLAAYVQTQNGARAQRLAVGLDFGMLAVNCVKMTGAPVPFGGMKQSGLGREGGAMGIDAFSDVKYVCMATNI
ncbi:NAD-dependent succinate-semialdehyde dehydrogenase [Varunaivibrio sulfuroxidans]|uniref:Aspartate-semialdehyde dehydrogenase n=1 Tax=Varunaivibrio sulfuroxidans TaxID=1773489 RepID=A0A4R3J3Y3_9PROT|nr:NAD-dependent succinate-semialdehyde dehydrogenase [Varunaivibrio sulfuroxidans]TCS60549.1 aspartate-semialdehyde dehydrogenase [Varunaivibrio sulfuroxidans]WES30039.1 NAD-dependent succinate-semialdehyde dehydrogenase [Varunaivibrio sulfuroxidans]